MIKVVFPVNGEGLYCSANDVGIIGYPLREKKVGLHVTFTGKKSRCIKDVHILKNYKSYLKD